MKWMVVLVVGSGACVVEGEGETLETLARTSPQYSISMGAADVEASPLLPRTVTITGKANQQLFVGLERPTSGALASSTVTLDKNGVGTVSYTPCAGVASTCRGPAAITVSLGNTRNTVASLPFNLVYPSAVGEVAPCNVAHNVMYLHGNDYIQNGVFETGASTPWEVFPGPDNVSFEVGGFTPDRFIGKFSSYHTERPFAAGVYEGAVREGFEEPGQPGIHVYGRSRGCNIIAGRFQVHELTQDAAGTVQSATISFEQGCDPEPDFTGLPTIKLMVGCFHYQSL